jgi:hypothetical protein
MSTQPIKPYSVVWGPEIHMSPNPYSEAGKAGELLLSITGDQNPDPQCGSSTCFQAQINRVEYESGYRWQLYWTDQVANDWTEEYDDASLALLRLAALVHSYEHDFESFFTSKGAKDFADNQAPAIFNHLLS